MILMENNNALFFDYASTTPCSDKSAQLMKRYSVEDYGNPASNHIYGQRASQPIRDARLFFTRHFKLNNPSQIIFTGSGSEANNLAIVGVAMQALSKPAAGTSNGASNKLKRIIVSAIEHPSVKKTAESLASFGPGNPYFFDIQFAPVDSNGQIIRERLFELLTPETILVSIMQVNNIMGSIQKVEEIAKEVRKRQARVLFHVDAVQSFCKIPAPTAPSAVDLVSISGHKIHGPKGVGALVLLNPVQARIRPLIWGGDQESGLRSGTQNAGLIAGFHAAAEAALQKQESFLNHCHQLKTRLHEQLTLLGLLSESHSLGSSGQGYKLGSKTDPKISPKIRWNSPEDGVPHIINLSVPGYPAAPFAGLLEEQHCLVSTGSACHSRKAEAEPVLAAMGLPLAVQESAIRVSLSDSVQLSDIDYLANAIKASLDRMSAFL